MDRDGAVCTNFEYLDEDALLEFDEQPRKRARKRLVQSPAFDIDFENIGRGIYSINLKLEHSFLFNFSLVFLSNSGR